MPGPFDPERLHGPGTALVHGQAVGEVDDLVLCAVNDQHGRGDFGDLVNASRQERGRKKKDHRLHTQCNIISYMKRVATPGSMHDTGCLGLVHWDNPEGWYGEGGGRRAQDI